MKGGSGRGLGGRYALLALLAACTMLLWPSSSQAFVACSFSGGQVRVDLTSDDDTVSFSRFGPQVAVLAGYDPQILVPCSGGTPTVDNTDSVLVQQAPARHGAEVALDLSRGPFAPGATPELDGTSEIEFNIQMSGRAPAFYITGTDGPENIQLGATASGGSGVNLNAGAEPPATADSDIELNGMRYAFIFTEGGPDVVSGMGGPGFTGPVSRPQFLASGSSGRDVLQASAAGSALAGGSGRDLIMGSSGRDFMEGGGGKDKLFAGKGKDEVGSVDGKKDLVRCGPGGDSVRADNHDKPKGCEDVHRSRVRHRRGLEQPVPVETAFSLGRIPGPRT